MLTGSSERHADAEDSLEAGNPILTSYLAYTTVLVLRGSLLRLKLVRASQASLLPACFFFLELKNPTAIQYPMENEEG